MQFIYISIALSKVNDSELSRDLVQEAFLTALEQYHTFEQRSSERSWLTGILKIKIYNVYKQRLKEAIYVANFYEKESDIFSKNHYIIGSSANSCALDPMATKEFFDFIKRCVRKWPQLWQTVFLLKFIELENKGEICRKLNLSSSYYWVICHRIKASLKTSLEKFWL